ncbi:hypothetical protein Hypma_001552 [Hypsizygus marmoreus]|uniref:Uncharacterized protein n=1 Tax=Hypsizygus marmoreus TaxID=39966 RepID=A0A369K8X4_HYPMA|nr:hypothetical protein Hypma_001552 [Hypsizygus marmoreus]
MPRGPSSNTDLDRKILWMYMLEKYKQVYRKNMATLPPKVQEQYHLKRHEAAARYRAKNRENLKEQARDCCADAYIDKYSYEAFCKNFKKC